MLVRVRKPRIEIEADPVPVDLIKFLRDRYGELDIEYNNDNDDELVAVEETAWYKDMSRKLHGGAVLRIRRETAGMTQAELSNRVKTSRTAIAAMESGARPITHTMARRLHEVFPESSVNDFLRIPEEDRGTQPRENKYPGRDSNA